MNCYLRTLKEARESMTKAARALEEAAAVLRKSPAATVTRFHINRIQGELDELLVDTLQAIKRAEGKDYE